MPSFERHAVDRSRLAPLDEIRYKPPPVAFLKLTTNGVARTRTFTLLLLTLLVWPGASACSRNIGDACATSADCDPSGGTRTCDLSQPGGYCLVEGCDARSCPEDSFCVRFFPEPFLTSSDGMAAGLACDDPADPSKTCGAGEVCVPSVRQASVCARAEWEKRACVRNCNGNDDCRGGYVCRETGVNGTIALTLKRGEQSGFCAPATIQQ